MAIDSKTAARIAKANNLTLSDARSLAAMADDEDHAKELAAEFGGEDYDAIADHVMNKGRL